MQEWYFMRDGRRQGPVTSAEFAEMLADGDLAADTVVWRDGMPEWVQASSRAEFFLQAVVPTQPNAALLLNYQTPLAFTVFRPRYAGFWLRSAAYILDCVILLPFQLLVSWALGTSPFSEQASAGAELLDTAIALVVQWLYWATLESSAAQGSLGKQIVGIIVTDLNGARIGFGRATGRHFAQVISAIPLGIGFLAAAFTRRKQSWHDMIAGTVVIRRPQRASAGAAQVRVAALDPS